MTYPAIESSRYVAFLVAGQEKATMFSAIRAGGSNVPAARVKPVGERIWFVDQGAPKPMATSQASHARCANRRCRGLR